MTYRTILNRSKEVEELYLVQFEDNGITIINNADLQNGDDISTDVGDSVSVKYGKKYIAAKILGKGKFKQTSHICIIKHKINCFLYTLCIITL